MFDIHDIGAPKPSRNEYSEDKGSLFIIMEGKPIFLESPHLYIQAEQLHWFPFSDRIQLKVLTLVLKARLGLAPKYLFDLHSK